MTRPPLVIAPGDPAGVGPELIAAAWVAGGLASFAVAGGARLIAAAAQQRGVVCPIAEIDDLAEAEAAFASGLPVLRGLDTEYRASQPDSQGATFALAGLTLATKLTVGGQASALVTAPVSKARLAEIGFEHPGQTEFVAEAAGVAPDRAVMLLAGPRLRVVPVTVHIALAEVPSALTTEAIVTKGRILAAALAADFGIAEPRVAVAALNPHAGEHGRMGSEDAAVIAPAIAALRAEGILATGPHPADALFTPRARETYDAALCMYHDQALVPLKALDFDEGVNCTLGLPIVRTSPDHGTAFDIAGTGKADPGAMIAAIRMAADIAARRAAL
jgi:4-hydroxythreonine-4-phosphate dehydrogenase